MAQQNNIAEEVAWIVGDEPIYKSQIEEQYSQLQYEKTPINGDPYCVIPEQLAIDKLFLHQAVIDTVTVEDATVAKEVKRTYQLLCRITRLEREVVSCITSASRFRKYVSNIWK